MGRDGRGRARTITATVKATAITIPALLAFGFIGNAETRGGVPSFSAVTAAGRVTFVVAADGNEARYRVKEQLVGVDLPGDAVGKTSKIEGAIVVEDNGSIVKEGSKFTIDLTTLQSDQQMRDNYLRRTTLLTAEHPTAVFVPGSFKGLPSPLPTSGEVKFQLVGDLTIRGVTKPVSWEVTATPSGGDISGKATTSFTFAEFQLEQPRVRRVLSVEDQIRLEYDFKLTRKTGI
jgi:polyisoprenoid-binding protein YceI